MQRKEKKQGRENLKFYFIKLGVNTQKFVNPHKPWNSKVDAHNLVEI